VKTLPISPADHVDNFVFGGRVWLSYSHAIEHIGEVSLMTLDRHTDTALFYRHVLGVL